LDFFGIQLSGTIFIEANTDIRFSRIKNRPSRLSTTTNIAEAEFEQRDSMDQTEAMLNELNTRDVNYNNIFKISNNNILKMLYHLFHLF
jgi:hypothetical protein